jgi:hypothetical protein
MDRPSAAFGSLGVDVITAVGEDLDRKVAALLRVLRVDAEAADGASGYSLISMRLGSRPAYAPATRTVSTPAS